MPELILIYKIITFLTVVASLWLGFWVYFTNRKSKINQLFLLLGISITFWITFYYLTITSTNINSVMFWSRLAYGSVSIFYLPFYFFFIYFLNLESKFRFLSKFVLLAGISFFIISVFTNWIVKDAIFENGRVDLILGKGNIGFYGLAIFLSILIIGLLFQKYFKVPYSEKLKIQYFLLGVSIWGLMNFIFNMVFPLIRGGIQYAEFGNYSVIFLLGFTAYAIVKRKLFDIKVVLTSLLVGLIAILFALDILVFTQNLFFQIIKGIAFLIFLFFGYLLIKSVGLEVKRREETEKISKAKSEFISIASHQLRTPLTAMKGYLSMILEGTYNGAISGKIKEKVENIYQSNERLINLVNDLLGVSRLEAGAIKLELEKTSLPETIKEIIEEIKIEAEKKNLYLKYQKPEKPLPNLFLDKEKIKEVILNLIDNAIKYTQKGGIIITTEIQNSGLKNKKKLLIKIKDTGVGLTKEEIEKLFESFSRSRAGTTFHIEGAGLGLYITRKFVEMHQGKVWVESEGKDKGSTFYIELPIK